MCTKYWLSACSSLPRKIMWLGELTIAVDLGRKATKQTKLYGLTLNLANNENPHEMPQNVERSRRVLDLGIGSKGH